MLMPFFAPLMLFGLVAAAAPVIIHLFRKRTARRVLWGAWQFLAESMRRNRRRILVEEIILLVVRTAILALAALAFARPFLPETGFFGGGEKDVVIVLDRSGSMNLKRKDGSSAFEAAVAEARDLIERAPNGVSFGLIAGDTEPEVLTATPFSSKREVLKLLDGLKAGTGSMDVPRALEAAGGVLSGGGHVAKEVVVFGDGQGYGWRPGDLNAWRRVEQAFASFARRPPVVWRTLERPEGVRNAAIASVVPSRPIFGTDRAVTFSVTVVNSGSVPFSPGELSLEVDGRRLASQPVGQVLPGLSRTIPFSCRFDKAGPHDVVAALASSDDIASDNVVSNRVRVIDELKALLVDGRPGARGFDRPTAYVEAALRPETKGDRDRFLIRPVGVRPAELEATNVFAGVAVTVLCDVPFLSDKASANLARWTSEGGGLLTVPGERTDLGFYTNWTWRSKKVLPAAWTNFVTIAGNVRPPTVFDAPVAGRMLFDESAIATNAVRVSARMDDGEIGVLEGPFGAGRVGMVAMPLDLGWTALPARPVFVPFVHDLVCSLSSEKSMSVRADLGWSAYEGNVAPLTSDETDAVASHVELSFARLKDDALAAVVGRGFGVEIWRPLAVAVLLLMLAEILLCRYIDNARAGTSPWGRASAAPPVRTVLRVLAFLALGWMLAHLVWVRDRPRKVSRKVAVLVDGSLSMRRYDLDANGETNSCTRLDVATNVAARLERALAEKYDVEGFDFGADTTDFAAALEAVRARIPAEELAGAMFVTDGRPTAGADVDSVTRLFARQGARISTVVVGSETNRPDLAIEDVAVAENLFLGERMNALVVMRADRLKGAKGVAKLMLGDRELGREELTIDSDAWRGEVRFTDEPKEKGLRKYRIVLETPAKDIERENDEWPLEVSVSDDRTNVLIADRRPRWEFRYLRNLFYGRDKSVHLQYVLTEPDRLAGETKQVLSPADATRKFGDAEAGTLPSGRDAWRKFDVMVFGDLPPDAFRAQDVDDIRYCVKERGATAVFICGERHMPLDYASSPLAELFPVALTNGRGRVVAAWRPGAYKFAVTGGGHAHEIMRLSESDAENVRIWETGCEWQRRLDGLVAKPGAETLAFAGDSDALKNPLVVVRHLGRGRVMFVASDETWRFRYKIGDTYHHRFWGNVLRWSTGAKLRDGNAFARVGTDRVHYAPSGRVRIRVRLTNADSLPLEGQKVVCAVRDPKGAEHAIELTALGALGGQYEGEYAETADCGEYAVEVSCPEAQKLLGNKWPEKLRTAFSVKTSFAPVEYAHLSSDRALPEALAKATGGSVYAIGMDAAVTVALASSTNDVAESAVPGSRRLTLNSFGTGRAEVVDHIENHIWDHPLAFVLLAAALIVVWILRKRKGLV